MVTTIILAVVVGAGLLASVVSSRQRTQRSVVRAVKLAKGILPEVLTILLLVSLALSFLNRDVIRWTLGNDNKVLSTVLGALIGAATIIPGIVAFPLAKELLAAGAAQIALAAFITTLTMVGVATSPIEKRHFGLRFTLYRNTLSFFLAVAVAFGMGVVL